MLWQLRSKQYIFLTLISAVLPNEILTYLIRFKKDKEGTKLKSVITVKEAYPTVIAKKQINSEIQL